MFEVDDKVKSLDSRDNPSEVFTVAETNIAHVSGMVSKLDNGAYRLDTHLVTCDLGEDHSCD